VTQRLPIQDERRRQWGQLLALTAAHFVLDSVPGLMHTVLPGFQESFQLTVASGATLLTVFLVAANGVQVLIGHIRPKADRPLFLHTGFVLVCAIALFAVVPPGGSALFWLCLISAVCGVGVGMTHPESLRAVHRLDRISSAVGSSVFMFGGVAGFAFGGWISTHLYAKYELRSLIPFCIASIVALLVIIFFRIRLATEKDKSEISQTHSDVSTPSIWLVVAMATLVAGSMTVFAWIVPQHVRQLGIDLTMGGLSVSVLSISGGVGSMDAGGGDSVYYGIFVFDTPSMGTGSVVRRRMLLFWCVSDLSQYRTPVQGGQSGPADGVDRGRRLVDRLRIADAAGADCRCCWGRLPSTLGPHRSCSAFRLGLYYR
jgi:FSR family fosmidomycin resistance protein-like MFS transporter